MIQRILIFLVVVALFAGLLAYSQMWEEPARISGSVEADDIRLGSRVGGRVARVHVDDGQAVTAGTVLVELEPFDLLARESEARARLAAAQAELDRFEAGNRAEEIAQAKARFDQLDARVKKLETGPRPQEIAIAKAQLDVAEAQLVLAEQQHKRISDVFRRGATTQDEMDRVTQEFRAATALLQVRQQELALLEEGTRQEEIDEARAMREEAHQAWELAQQGFRQEDVAQARAQRDAAQDALDVILSQKKELSIVAPLDGLVEAIELQPGDLVSAGAPVLTMLDTSHLWVWSYIPENRLDVQVGRIVDITTDSYPGRKWQGTVSFVSRQAEFTPNNVQTPEERSKEVFRIKVEINEGHRELRPGMPVDVWLDPQGEPAKENSANATPTTEVS